MEYPVDVQFVHRTENNVGELFTYFFA